MNNKYIIFDVETPNSYNNRISAIGITVVENGCITDGCYHLVNPDTHFDDFNISLTKIHPDMVKDKPNFKELWKIIEPIMSDGILVAHNAPFDMGVLSKCLRDYKIEWKPYAKYLCTCQASRKLMTNLPNHKLNTISDYLGFTLDHHNAKSDAIACAGILLHLMSLCGNLQNFIKTYDLINICTRKGM